MLKWLILACLFLGMGYWALYEKNEKVYEHDGVRLPWTIESIKQAYRVEFKQGNQRIMVLRHPTGMWWLAEPEKGMANQYKMSVWLNTLMMPKVMRWLEPTDQQRQLIANGIAVELEYAKDKVHKIVYYELADRKDSVFVYVPQLDKILVLEMHEKMGQKLSLMSYRTIRIFPFKPDSTTVMEYQVKGRSFRLTKTEKGWDINFKMSKVWEQLLRKMYNAASVGFVEQRIPGELLASWVFEYESGDKSKLELFLTEKGYVAYYRGRDIGQILDQREVNAFFPGSLID